MTNLSLKKSIAGKAAMMMVAGAGLVLAGCSSESDLNPNSGVKDDNVQVAKLTVTTGSNPSLAKTYFNSHQNGTRGANDVLEHPGMPEVPAAYDMTFTPETNFYYLSIVLPASTPESEMPSGSEFGNKIRLAPGVYENGIKGGELTVRVSIPHFDDNPGYAKFYKEYVVKNPQYYIDGDVTIAGTGDNNEMGIYILNKGKLTDRSVLQSKTNVYLYEGGQILRANQNGEHGIHIQGNLFADGAINDADAEIEVLGNIYTTNKIHGKTVTLVGGEVYAGCAVTAVETIYLTGDNSIVSAGYVSAPVVELAGNSPLKIQLRDGGYLNATDRLNVKNVGNCFVYANDEEYAMVATKVLEANNVDLTGVFYNVAVKFEEKDGSQEADEFTFNESCDINGEIVYDVIDGDSCAPKMVTKPADPTPDPDPTPKPELENIGSVAPADGIDHTHPISATSIFTNGKDAYLSWHTQGPNFHGCIEYLTVDNGNVTLNSFLETSPENETYGAVDFNHVIFDAQKNRLFVAGDHPTKGGILGWINCPDGKFTTGEAELNIRQLYNAEGGSGNCIIRNGNYYQVASVKGFETFVVNEFDTVAKPKAVARLAAADFPGASAEDSRLSGKHIATDGQNVVMLTLVNRDNAANTANASIRVYSVADVNYENPVASYVVNDAVLSPVDGKDVIAIKGNDIYVCLGKGGVQHLQLAGNTLTKVAEFVLTDMSKEELKGFEMSVKEAAASCANGLAVGDDYVYVAHGGAGLVVLDKNDLSFVTRTRHNGGNSANYVSLHEDGYIYVAYGKSNVQVFGWKK